MDPTGTGSKESCPAAANNSGGPHAIADRPPASRRRRNAALLDSLGEEVVHSSTFSEKRS